MNYYNEIKNELINNEVYKRVKDYSKNRSDLNTYYNVGKLLVEAGKSYGEGIIRKYSVKLTNEIGKGYNSSSLKRMRQFYLMIEKGATVWHQLSWSHYRLLLVFDDISKINYYLNASVNQNLSVRQLNNKLKNNEYEGLPISAKQKLIQKVENEISDFIKEPILIKNSNNYAEISEKILKQLILEDLHNFLTELGERFCFIKDEYKIKLDDRYNYIDKVNFYII